jgi:hypothetical protein
MSNYQLPIINYQLRVLFVICCVLFTSCSRGFKPEPLTLSVKQNLALLQTDPQFVMYFNFKKMRETGFWTKFISDSLLNNERNFGNFLYNLKQATGASISGGIDELYFSNSWTGENAIVVRGTFDRSKIDNFVKNDTAYSKFVHQKGFTVYENQQKSFYFYFKDGFTLCASNYLRQVENTMDVKDTSRAGLLTNSDAMRAIENILYKEHLWMMSNQKLFISGIYENLSDTKIIGRFPGSSGNDSAEQKDTSKTGGLIDLSSIYEKVNAVSFAVKMTDNVQLDMQNECDDNKSADELKNLLDGVIALTKISTKLSQKKASAVLNLLENIKINSYDKTVLLELKITDKQVEDIRKQRVFQ